MTAISRFGRNTVDTLKYIRELRELGISVFFETQNIDTMSAKGEMMLIVLSAIAAEESRTMSTNIKWAFQKRFKDGQVINYRFTLGYTKVNDEYIIVEGEAEIVRRIFREYLDDKKHAPVRFEYPIKSLRKFFVTFSLVITTYIYSLSLLVSFACNALYYLL